MTGEKSGVFTGGAGLVWRRQRVLWWPFVVNLVLAHFAAHVTLARVEPLLNSSLASERLLVHGFHFSAVLELMGGPENRLSFGPEGFVFALVFFFFMLLATGGILEAYWRDDTQTATEFFRNGGKYFWRFLRLVLFLIVALIPVGILAAIGSSISGRVDRTAISPFPAVWINLATALVVLLLLMIVRLWFDMAEVIAVAEGETASWRCLRDAAGLLAHNFGSLFWLYFRISFLAWLGEALLLHIWVRHVPHGWVGVSFIMAQLIVLFWMGMRWWQRASEVLWYQAWGMADISRRSEPVNPMPPPVPAQELVTLG
jgi:hypothetical protein